MAGFISGMNQQTPAVQSIYRQAVGSRGARSASKPARRRKAKAKGTTRRKAKSSSTKKYNSAAWMAKIRKMRGKKKKK